MTLMSLPDDEISGAFSPSAPPRPRRVQTRPGAVLCFDDAETAVTVRPAHVHGDPDPTLPSTWGYGEPCAPLTHDELTAEQSLLGPDQGLLAALVSFAASVERAAHLGGETSTHEALQTAATAALNSLDRAGQQALRTHLAAGLPLAGALDDVGPVGLCVRRIFAMLAAEQRWREVDFGS